MSETLPKRITTEQLVEVPARRNVLDFINVVPFRSGDVTPKVSNNRIFKTVGNAIITNFTGGQEGQEILIHGNGLTAVDHNSNIVRRDGQAGLLELNKIYIFVLIDGVWCESA